jgi:hypothetical protein
VIASSPGGGRHRLIPDISDKHLRISGVAGYVALVLLATSLVPNATWGELDRGHHYDELCRA